VSHRVPPDASFGFAAAKKGCLLSIPKGANGEATVVEVDHAGGNGHGGKLSLTFDWAYSADHGNAAFVRGRDVFDH